MPGPKLDGASIATGLLQAGYGAGAVALYVMGLAAITIAAVLAADETHRRDIA